MTLKRRIRRLETSAMSTKAGAEGPPTVVLEGVAPGPAGLEVVSLALLTPRGGDTVHLERDPGENEVAFRARFDAAAEAVGKGTQNNGELQ